MNNQQAQQAQAAEIQPFLHPHQVNFIGKELRTLISAFYFAGDYRVLAASRESVVGSLHEALGLLTPAQQALIDEAGHVRDHDELKAYLQKLKPYVIPFPEITAAEIRKLFPKVKKLVLPDLSTIDRSRIEYLGWRDLATNSIYFVRQIDGKWVGNQCQVTLGQKGRTYMCSWCGRGWAGDGVALVTKQLKVKNVQDGYKTIGHHLCLDSQACNDSLTKITDMEAFLSTVK